MRQTMPKHRVHTPSIIAPILVCTVTLNAVVQEGSRNSSRAEVAAQADFLMDRCNAIDASMKASPAMKVKSEIVPTSTIIHPAIRGKPKMPIGQRKQLKGLRTKLFLCIIRSDGN